MLQLSRKETGNGQTASRQHCKRTRNATTLRKTHHKRKSSFADSAEEDLSFVVPCGARGSGQPSALAREARTERGPNTRTPTRRGCVRPRRGGVPRLQH